MLNRFFGSNLKKVNPYENAGLSQEELYEKLLQYYENNGLYDDVQWNAYYGNYWAERIKPLRTVVNRSVEFFVSKILSGDSVTINTDSNPVKEAIDQILKWSNFDSQKRLAVRELSLFGNLFWRVSIEDGKVYFEIVDPRYVTSFKTDNRGYITEIRTDEPITVEGEKFIHTEYWNKEYYSIWEYRDLGKMELEQLPTPVDSGFLLELGIDFVPFVHVKFREIPSSKYGAASVQHALDKIDEANREATKLAERVYVDGKKLLVVSTSKTTKEGKLQAAPLIDGKKDVEIKDDSILYLPEGAGITALDRNINYDPLRNLVNDMVAELEKDLPELKYYSLQDNQLSGEAIRLLLAGAIDRAEEAQSNFLQGFVRIIQIALTMGVSFGIFKGIGTYEDGDFEFSIVTPEMFPMSLNSKATLLKDFVLAGLALPTALRLAGYSEEFIQTAVAEKSNEITPQLTNALTNFNSR